MTRSKRMRSKPDRGPLPRRGQRANPPVEHPKTTVVKAGEAFLESIYWSTPGVVNLVQELKGVENDGRRAFSDNVGTASAVRWRGRTLLITAAHVLDGAMPDQLAFLTRPSGAIGTVLQPGGPGTIRHPLPIENAFKCTWDDLAVLEFGSIQQHVNLRFVDIDENEQTPDPGIQLLAIGYPASSAVVVGTQYYGLQESRALGITPTLVDADLEDPTMHSAYLSGFDPGRHILVHFTPSDSIQKAPGFSGTGFWYYKQEQTREELWYSRPRLAGVCTHQYEAGKLLRGVRAELVVKFLQEIS